MAATITNVRLVVEHGLVMTPDPASSEAVCDCQGIAAAVHEATLRFLSSSSERWPTGTSIALDERERRIEELEKFKIGTLLRRLVEAADSLLEEIHYNYGCDPRCEADHHAALADARRALGEKGIP